MDNRTVVLFAHPSRDVRNFVDHIGEESGYRTILSFDAAKTCSDGIIVDTVPLLVESITMALDTRKVVVLDDIIGNPNFAIADIPEIRSCGATLIWICRRRRGLRYIHQILQVAEVLIDTCFGHKRIDKTERWWNLNGILEYDYFYESDNLRSYRAMPTRIDKNTGGSTIQNLLNRLADFYLRDQLCSS